MRDNEQPDIKANRTDYVNRASTIAFIISSVAILLSLVIIIFYQVISVKSNFGLLFLILALVISVLSLLSIVFIDKHFEQYDLIQQRNIWLIHDPDGNNCTSARRFTIQSKSPIESFDCYIDPEEEVTSIDINSLIGEDYLPVIEDGKKRITIPFSGAQKSDKNPICFVLNTERNKDLSNKNKYINHFSFNKANSINEVIKFRNIPRNYRQLIAHNYKKSKGKTFLFKSEIKEIIECIVEKKKIWSIEWEDQNISSESEFHLKWIWK